MDRKTVITVIAAAGVGLLIAYLLSGEGSGSSDGGGDLQPSATSSEPERVICMSPSVTELVFALGQEERVVGVSSHTEHPPEAREKTRCGGFVDPEFEVITELRPDLIITQGLGRKITAFADERNIPTVSLELTDLDSIIEAIRRLGRALQCQERAEQLKDEILGRLDDIREKTRGLSEPDVLLIIGREPGSLRNLNTVGPDSYLHDVLEMAGGRNIFEDLERDYGSVSREAVVERAPDVIIELHGEGMMGRDEKKGIRETWQELNTIPAVQNGRIYAVGETYALIPGPRVTELAEHIARLLHEETAQ